MLLVPISKLLDPGSVLLDSLVLDLRLSASGPRDHASGLLTCFWSSGPGSWTMEQGLWTIYPMLLVVGSRLLDLGSVLLNSLVLDLRLSVSGPQI